MGVKVDEYDDGFGCEGKTGLKGGNINTYGDHRIAMAFAVASLVAEEKTIIQDSECVSVSCPNFFKTLKILSR